MLLVLIVGNCQIECAVYIVASVDPLVCILNIRSCVCHNKWDRFSDSINVWLTCCLFLCCNYHSIAWLSVARVCCCSWYRWHGGCGGWSRPIRCWSINTQGNVQNRRTDIQRAAEQIDADVEQHECQLCSLHYSKPWKEGQTMCNLVVCVIFSVAQLCW